MELAHFSLASSHRNPSGGCLGSEALRGLVKSHSSFNCASFGAIARTKEHPFAVVRLRSKNS